MKPRIKGFSLVELMIAIALSSIIAAGSLTLFFSQSRAIDNDERRSQNMALSENIFTELNSLLRHAIASTINIQYGSGRLNSDEVELDDDMITIDFSLPPDYPIWPNDKLPYDKPWVRLQWSNNPNGDNPNNLLIGTAATDTALAFTTLAPLHTSEDISIVANIDLWPLDSAGQPLASPQATPSGGYLLQLSSRTINADSSYFNPKLDQEDPLVHFRTNQTSGIVSPRN